MNHKRCHPSMTSINIFKINNFIFVNARVNHQTERTHKEKGTGTKYERVEKGRKGESTIYRIGHTCMRYSSPKVWDKQFTTAAQYHISITCLSSYQYARVHIHCLHTLSSIPGIESQTNTRCVRHMLTFSCARIYDMKWQHSSYIPEATTHSIKLPKHHRTIQKEFTSSFF